MATKTDHWNIFLSSRGRSYSRWRVSLADFLIVTDDCFSTVNSDTDDAPNWYVKWVSPWCFCSSLVGSSGAGTSIATNGYTSRPINSRSISSSIGLTLHNRRVNSTIARHQPWHTHSLVGSQIGPVVGCAIQNNPGGGGVTRVLLLLALLFGSSTDSVLIHFGNDVLVFPLCKVTTTTLTHVIALVFGPGAFLCTFPSLSTAWHMMALSGRALQMSKKCFLSCEGNGAFDICTQSLSHLKSHIVWRVFQTQEFNLWQQLAPAEI